MPMIPVLHFVAVEEYSNDNYGNTRYADADGNCGCIVCNVSCNKHDLLQKYGVIKTKVKP